MSNAWITYTSQNIVRDLKILPLRYKNKNFCSLQMPLNCNVIKYMWQDIFIYLVGEIEGKCCLFMHGCLSWEQFNNWPIFVWQQYKKFKAAILVTKILFQLILHFESMLFHFFHNCIIHVVSSGGEKKQTNLEASYRLHMYMATLKYLLRCHAWNTSHWICSCCMWIR